ncbi:MAG TPA: tannase/feruloyl esterase family alpha/beta hydrolase [Bryobacteraceae bacterium]|nr:tannase/feruloyl esterase family alpha/beta hydrolase [Bryobacteraceae bacterium]
MGHPEKLIDFGVVKQTNAGDSIRLCMVPGMGHCRGGGGPDRFNAMAALRVKAGKAPDRIVALHLTKGIADRTRPLCPYPREAQYKGGGSTGAAANFVCKLP